MLIIGIGNPSRGDDALGTLAIERLAALDLPDTELLTDFQLQIEHALDLVGRREVVFIDAAASGPEPFAFEPLDPAQNTGPLTHALPPAAVLAAYRHVSTTPPPAAFVLAVRGYEFGLGVTPSDTAIENLDAALQMLATRIMADTGRSLPNARPA
ncbi:MAG: hydrogenase maturation protease [Xanthomonadales bacterium]|nr:hydrogenase maturation protease [Gammaproteobacteria bacterium]MBT8122975.1 hydrogenase maturation protease [Gammaproteobacteria bacterium]NNK05151.1 hydrogenase maturation protease [Xanthomonadales bacterium]